VDSVATTDVDTIIRALGVCIPQRRYGPRIPGPSPFVQETILFIVDGHGFPLQDALAGTYAGLSGRDDLMFAEDVGSCVNVRIEVSVSRFVVLKP